MTEQFKWVDYYEEFASKLLEYRNNRKELIDKIVKVYDSIEMKLPKLEANGIPEDIDPFTIFGLFNKGITNDNRISILGGIAKEFSISAEVPQDFDGIPVLNNMMATFYAFEGDERKNDSDIQNLWTVFESAINLAKQDDSSNRATFADAYDQALSQFGVKWNLTMALYWIRPYAFVNLDSRNREFMGNPENISANVVADVKAMKNVPSAVQYLNLRDKCSEALKSGNYEYTSFPELSYKAWVMSLENEEMEKELKDEKSNAAFLRWFKPVIQALRDLGGSATPADTRAKIIENEKLTSEEINATRGKNNVNKFENEVAFARSYLVKAGYIDNSVYGVWTLTELGKTCEMTENLASEIFKQGVTDNVVKRKSKNTLGDADVETTHYWMYSPGEGASYWDEVCKAKVMALGWHEIGDLNAFATKDEIAQKLREELGGESSYKNSAHALWQFAHEINVGDVIIVKKGRSDIIGRGIVESDYEYDESFSEDHPNIRRVKWTDKVNCHTEDTFAMKTLTDITNYPDFLEKVLSVFEGEEEDSEDVKVINYPKYTLEEFFNQVYISEESYNDIVGVLENKKNIILQGAPGVGKTYIAKRLAYSIMGEKDVNRVMMVQFH